MALKKNVGTGERHNLLLGRAFSPEKGENLCVKESREGLVVKNLPGQPVHARTHRGKAGAYFDFDRLRALEAHISELLPGKAAEMHQHTCEALFYVLSGRATLSFRRWDNPRNRWSGQREAQPVRYLEITTLPLMKALGAWRVETEKLKRRDVKL